MMSKEEFQDVILEELNRQFPQGYSLSVIDVLKSNDTPYTGITITKEGSSIGTTMYVEHLYEDYQRGATPETIAEHCREQYDSQDLETDIPKFDKDFVLSNVYYRMANEDQNRRRFQDVPTWKAPGVDDIVLYPCVAVTVAGRNGVTIIHESQMESLGITREELHESAIRNTEARIEIQPLKNVLAGIVPGAEPEQFDSPLLIAMDKDSHAMVGGASPLAAPSAFAQLKEPCYILPSSVHELLLIPASSVEDEDYLRSMVKDVNMNVMEAEDILSYNIYKVDEGKFQTLSLGMEKDLHAEVG